MRGCLGFQGCSIGILTEEMSGFWGIDTAFDGRTATILGSPAPQALKCSFSSLDWFVGYRSRRSSPDLANGFSQLNSRFLPFRLFFQTLNLPPSSPSPNPVPRVCPPSVASSFSRRITVSHIIMSVVNRSIRTASRSLRLRSTPLALTTSLASSSSSSSSTTTTRLSSALHLHSRRAFSTTTARMSSAPMPTQQKGYDPEIEDIAKYVTRPIDSELAVSRRRICRFSLCPRLRCPGPLLTGCARRSSTQHDGCSSIRWAVAWRACASRSARSFWDLSFQAPSFPTAPRFPAPTSSSIPSMVPSTSAP